MLLSTGLTVMEISSKVEDMYLKPHPCLWKVINAFCRLKETEMKMKVITRLQNITYLQTLLERALAGKFLICQYLGV